MSQPDQPGSGGGDAGNHPGAAGPTLPRHFGNRQLSDNPEPVADGATSGTATPEPVTEQPEPVTEDAMKERIAAELEAVRQRSLGLTTQLLDEPDLVRAHQVHLKLAHLLG